MTTNQICIQGVGRLEIEPDTAVISCHFSVLDPSYAGANQELNRRVELLRQSLPAVGLAKTDLKTRSFSVVRTFRFNQKDNTREFSGFTTHHSLELRMPLDKERVNQTMESLLTSQADAMVDVSFTVADPEPVRARLLAAAVKNARARAETIAHAAGVQLGKIANIQHGAVEVRFGQMRHDAEGATANLRPDLNAGSFVWADQVTVTWELAQ